MKTKLFSLAAAASLLLLITSSALALIVPVGQDTCSNKSGELTSKDGKAASLTVSNDRTALLEFDLSNLDVVPAAIDPSNVKSAILELYVIKTNTAANLTVQVVTSPWSESFSTATAPLPNIGPTVSGTPRSRSRYRRSPRAWRR